MKQVWVGVALVLCGCGVTVPGPVDPMGEEVTYRSENDLVQASAYHLPQKGPFPGLVIAHGDFGPTPFVKLQGQRLAGQGYLTLVVDLYRGESVGDLMDAHIMGRGLPDDRVRQDLKAAVDYLVQRPDVEPGAIGVLGFGLGGGYALDAALADSRIKAVVTCYGRLSTDAETLKPLRASVLGIFGAKDEGISPENRDRFRTAMEAAGKELAGLEVFADCGHGFLDPAEPGVITSEESWRKAWQRIDEFLHHQLRP